MKGKEAALYFESPALDQSRRTLAPSSGHLKIYQSCLKVVRVHNEMDVWQVKLLGYFNIKSKQESPQTRCDVAVDLGDNM